jgi:hypothetical protein
MKDIENGDSQPSTTTTLAKQGIAAVAYTSGGVFLFVLQAVSRMRVFGLILGAVVCAAGIASLLSKDPADKKAGALVTGAGVLVILSKSGIPAIQAAAGTLLAIGATGLLAMGVLNAFRFVRGLAKRS